MNTERSFTRWNRRLTKGFIDYVPVRAMLTRQTRTRTVTGGWTEAANAVPIYIQLVAVLNLAGEDAALRTVDGVERRATYMLIGAYGADIQINDLFTDEQGELHRVAHIMPDNGYEVRATTVQHGR